MSINDEFKNPTVEIETKVEEKQVEEEKKPKRKLKINKKKLYYGILGGFLAVVVIIGALAIHSALTYVAGAFLDYSMAPTINSVIKNEEGITYNYSNFREEDGNVVNFGLIEPMKTIKTIKRFDVLAIRKYDSAYLFDAIRVIGLPGETVRLDYDGNLYINGTLVNQPIDKEFLTLDWSQYDQPKEQLYFETTLENDEYYLLKDNRYYYKNDSRYRGAYKLDSIYGKVIAIQGTCTIRGTSFINCSFPLTRFI